ncbi:hypothetical protein J42TS3_42780 [Paenibacillus vini]|uniref:LysM domain-containing protein n=1 Tax=Paenibacillus vini TaxID=1476024 RepID=A0ABQ4MGY4_9BACL|nr:hypothetical protein J42TS3_42780 [Paenibacillus vini]
MITEFWLKFNNGAETLQLPVNPDTISVTSTHGYTDINVTNLGEYTVIGGGQLREYSLSSFFPRDHNTSFCAVPSLVEPYECVATIERWQRSGKPVRFIVTGTPINIAVTIRNFEYGERGGEPGDVYFTLDLKEYVFITVAKKGDNSAVSGSASVTMPKLAAARPSTRETPKSYTVKSGDSLFKIAAKVYGKGDDWRKIYEKNKKVIGANPNAIKPGQKLVIPS